LAIVAGLSISAAITIALGLAQASGRSLPAALTASEGPAALFGNVNMAAQFLGLALLLVLSTPAGRDGPRRMAWNVTRVALGVNGAAYLYVVSSRSVLLALAVSLWCVAWGNRPRRLVAVAAGTAGIALLAFVWWQPWAQRDPALAARKATSVELRLALWADTLEMIRNHPLGVGTGNFEQAFLPYQARGRLQPEEALVYRGPHNEYLRFVAEDGVLFCAVAAALAALLSLRWRRSPAPPPGLRTLVVAWGSFLAVEAVFQFPLALAFGALAASITVGAALAAVETDSGAKASRGAWIAGGTLASVLLLAASLRVAASEYLYVTAADDLGSQRRACALDPRNLPACVTAAWLEMREGDAPAAKDRLATVLSGAPHYPPALKLLGEIAAMEGDHAEACRRLGAYDALFRGRSSVHASATQACAEAR
jgi:hypothetical protein